MLSHYCVRGIVLKLYVQWRMLILVEHPTILADMHMYINLNTLNEFIVNASANFMNIIQIYLQANILQPTPWNEDIFDLFLWLYSVEMRIQDLLVKFT